MKIIKKNNKIAIKSESVNHGDKIIKYLESLGAINYSKFRGIETAALYYIENKKIKAVLNISRNYTELKSKGYKIISSNKIN